jgi:hypothetical protein
MPRQDFIATLFSLSADATAVGNTTTETIIVPDFVFPAYTFIQGTKIRATFMGRISNVVTAVPTTTFRVRVGTATLSGTAVFASGALAANATANTNLTWRGEYTLTCRTNGTAGTIMCAGQIWLPNLTAGNAVGNVGYPNFIPVTAPATQTIDTTVTNVLSLSAQWSAANASNTIQVQEYSLESMN